MTTAQTGNNVKFAQVPRTFQRVRLQRLVCPVLLPLVRTGFGKVVGPGQIENRSTRKESDGNERDSSGRDDRQTFDVQQRRGDSAVSRT